MSLACAARFHQQWDRLLQLSQELPDASPEQQAAQICVQADLALFRKNDPDLARSLYMQAIDLSPSIPDSRLRLACMALFQDGKLSFDGIRTRLAFEFVFFGGFLIIQTGSGHPSCGLANLTSSLIDEAYSWLVSVKVPEQSNSRFASDLAQAPYRWILMAYSIYLRALIEEHRGEWQAAGQTYSDIWTLLVSPVLNSLAMPSAAGATPDIAAADPHRITQVSNCRILLKLSAVIIAVLAGRCRVFLRLRQFDRFLDAARRWCRFDGDLAAAPRVHLGFCQRFAEMLVFYNLSLYQLYSSETNRKTRCDFRSPLEEAAFLLWLVLERVHSEFPDLENDLGRSTLVTARLLLSVCDQFSAIADLYRDDIALDLSNRELWFIRSLALYCSESYTESYLAVKSAIRLHPKGVEQLLFASKLLLYHLSNAKQAMKFAEDALGCCPKSSHLRASCHFLCGSASSRLAYEVWTFSRRKHLQQEALKQSIEAAKYQPKNQKFIFSVATVQADIREINLAIRLTKQSLSFNSSHFESWHLMALLFTSQKLYDEALQVCNAGSSECHGSHTLNFLFTQCKILTGQLLFEDLSPIEQNILVSRALDSFQKLFSKGLVANEQLKFVSIGPYHSCPLLFRPTDVDVPVTVTQQALAAKPRNALQSLCSPAFRYDDPDSLRYRAVLALVDLYAFVARTPSLNLSDAIPIAYSCLDYLIGLGSASWLPDIYVKLGELSEQNGDLLTALSHYELSLSFDGQHTEALVRIGALHNKMQKPVIAHEYLLTALRIDSTLHDAWLEIGQILHGQGKYDAASEAIVTALELERTAPVESFYAVARSV